MDLGDIEDLNVRQRKIKGEMNANKKQLVTLKVRLLLGSSVLCLICFRRMRKR